MEQQDIQKVRFYFQLGALLVLQKLAHTPNPYLLLELSLLLLAQLSIFCVWETS